jgi:hypothetical protein
LLALFSLLLTAPLLARAVKFTVAATHGTSSQRCIWNYAMAETLVVITANVEKGDRARLDLEVVDGSNHRNVYQARRGLQGEMRLAITTHHDADLGVCFKNTLDASEPLVADPPDGSR